MTDPRGVSAITALSDKLVADQAALSPITATYIGVSGHDHELDDLSPQGLSAGADLARSARAALRAAPAAGAGDEVARNVAVERLDVALDLFDSGWSHADLNVIDSPLQNVRMVFDLMPTETAQEQETLAERMRAVPKALAGYAESLRHGASNGKVAARRQVDKCAEQARTYAGAGTEGGFFSGLAASLGDSPELATAARAADAAYGEFAEFLTGELLAKAPDRDAVGRERYVLASRNFLGASIDLEETYAWGWQEFLSIEAELKQVAERIAPGAGAAGAAAQLDEQPRYQVQGVDALQAWMQELSDRAVAELGRSHFDIPGPVQKLECRIAPPGGGVGAYYTGPSDDFSRPGRMWWSVDPHRTAFPTWRETTTVYHEGVPGHHLQIATAVHQRAELNDFQRLLAGTSGHAEGWALYAERLVRELGYLEDDGDLLGMLDAQLFRAARVIVDLGMHLELELPEVGGFHVGERWTPELGLEFMLTRTITDPAHVRDEIDRYLGWPGQAPAYKVGERIWLAGREDARRRHGAAFDHKDFHTRALNLGGMGLDPLATALAEL